jgi:hypothetical protein
VDPSRHTRWLVRAAERKRVFRSDRNDEQRADDAGGLAGSEFARLGRPGRFHLL